ncbi:MAG: metallophosphoesterase family protein [Bradymonadales bacterium]|nr:metallophosphoesterase family protein [Bradymonadales bacterium]
MPRIAVFSDVHGNLPALEAITREIQRRKPDHLICLGDLVAFGPQPAETLSFLREEVKPTVVIKGNTDRWITQRVWEKGSAPAVDQVFLDSIAWTADRIGSEGIAYLDSLSDETTLDLGELEIHLCHGMPGDDEQGIKRGVIEQVADAVSKVKAQVVFCGHTHLPLRTRIGDREVLNVGSVGLPFDGDFRPCYLSCFIGHGALQEITFCRVSYSRAKTIDLLEHSDMPGSAVIIHRLQTATPSRPKSQG